MTKFLELKNKYESLVAAEDGYWIDLRQTAKEILEGFCVFLGAPEPEAEGNGQWVYFGRIGLEGFEQCDFDQLEKSKNLLHFALLLNLSAELKCEPSSQQVLSLRLCKVGTKYQASSTDAAIYPAPFSRGEYGNLFLDMYKTLEKKLDSLELAAPR